MPANKKVSLGTHCSHGLLINYVAANVCSACNKKGGDTTSEAKMEKEIFCVDLDPFSLAVWWLLRNAAFRLALTHHACSYDGV